MTFDNGTTTGRTTSHPYKKGDKVRITGGYFINHVGTVDADYCNPTVWVRVRGVHNLASVGCQIRRTRLMKLDAITELGRLAR